jgi:hypothetical protein
MRKGFHRRGCRRSHFDTHATITGMNAAMALHLSLTSGSQAWPPPPHRKGPPMAAKRELISPNGDKRFIRRDEQGRIVESDDAGKSLAQDVRKAAKATTKPGQGDKGDRKR